MATQTEWLEKDYYAVLGVPETASEQDITRAYRRLARELHPDTHPDSPDAEERFKEVSAAHEVLGDETKRREYDELRRLQRSGARAAPGGGGGFRIRFGDLEDLGDLGGLGDLGDLFGDLIGGSSRRQGPRRGQDLEAELTLGFEDAVRGTTATLRVTGSTPRQATVRVPAGIEDGQLIRVPGQGGAGRDGGPPGDLYVTVRVSPHPVFGRQGPHLTVRLPMTFAEAALGADVRVPTLDGEPVTLRIPPGAPAGRTFRVRGRGVPGRGDLLVTVEVAVPTRLTPAQRAAVEALAGATPESPRSHLGV